MATLTQSHLSSLLFISFFLSFSSSSSSSNTHLHVADFGASDDGETDASPSFLAAWDIACNSELPTTIYVPRRRYFLTPLVFQGPCMSPGITLHITGILVAPDYIEMGSTENWLTFDNVERVSIIGGYLDAQGSDLWDCKRFKRRCPAGATSLAIFSSKNIVIRGLSSMDAKLYHIVVHSCENVTLDSVRIYAPEDSPNTDGIHVQNAVNVQVVNTGIMTGDDCISIGPGTRNLWIQRVFCGPGHGISIGSLGKGLEEDGVVNVTVTNAVFSGTTNGLRIKSWGRPSNGYVKGVVFKRVMMRNVKNPILIDQNYCPRNEGCPNQNSGIKISQVTYADIRGTSASQVAVKFDCSATAPCKAIGLENIELTYQKKPAESFCRNIRGVARGLGKTAAEICVWTEFIPRLPKQLFTLSCRCLFSLWDGSDTNRNCDFTIYVMNHPKGEKGICLYLSVSSGLGYQDSNLRTTDNYKTISNGNVNVYIFCCHVGL